MITLVVLSIAAWVTLSSVLIARVGNRPRFANRELPAAWVVRELPSIASHPTRISGPIRVTQGCRVSPNCTEESCRWR